MTIAELKEFIIEGNDFYFSYNGKEAGVELTVTDYKYTFDAYFDDFTKQYTDLDTMLNDPIFDGRSVIDLLENNLIEISFV